MRGSQVVVTGKTARGERNQLFQPERRQAIIELLEQQGAVEVADLTRRFGVTDETIRRDLSMLQSQQLLQRVHGGAVKPAAFEPYVTKRRHSEDAQKQRIAARAVEEVPAAGSILIDAGSTLLRFAESLRPAPSVQVVTNSLPTAQAAANNGAGSVTIIGGELRGETMSIVDAAAVNTIATLSVDVLFISADGVSAQGLMTPYSHEASLKQAMINAAKRVVALIDSSKFGVDQLHRYATWEQVDILVCDDDAPAPMVAEIEAAGVQVVRV